MPQKPTKRIVLTSLVEKRVVTAPVHTLKPKSSPSALNCPPRIVQVKAQQIRCERCGHSVREKDLKRHLRLNLCNLYRSHVDITEETTSSIRAVSGGLPSLGKRSR